MRRRLLILAAFLLAGAVVNVAVAWGIAGASTNYDVMQDPVWEASRTKPPARILFKASAQQSTNAMRRFPGKGVPIWVAA